MAWWGHLEIEIHGHWFGTVAPPRRSEFDLNIYCGVIANRTYTNEFHLGHPFTQSISNVNSREFGQNMVVSLMPQ